METKEKLTLTHIGTVAILSRLESNGKTTGFFMLLYPLTALVCRWVKGRSY